LGHVISEAGIATDPEKTKIVESWPVICPIATLLVLFPSISQMVLELLLVQMA
jgi:hypothetical protein